MSEDLVPVKGFHQQDVLDKTFSSRVTLDNVMTLTNMLGELKSPTRALGSEDIICITGKESDTLFYVVNYPEGGWKMFASDMRVPAVVAECETGAFVLEDANRVYGAWLEDMMDDMKLVHNSTDNLLNFTKEEICANVEYWMSVCDADTYVRLYSKNQTRNGNYNQIIQEGQYVLDTIYSYYTLYDSLPHLTQTRWSQGEPYNYYCPMRSDEEEKALAGCVAIAGAQMIYYLHSKLGVPEYIPDSAYCTGDINNHIFEKYTNYRNIWQLATNNGNGSFLICDFNGNYIPNGRLFAPLIADIGDIVDMRYGNRASSAQTKNLVDVFNCYGISCKYVDFDEDLLYQSLSNGMPVIAKAQSSSSGHAFIIDGYKRRALRTTYVYKWKSNMIPLPGGPGGSFIPGPGLGTEFTPADSIVNTYSKMSLLKIKMNWGWGSEHDYYGVKTHPNNIWFVPTGDWIVDTDNYNGSRKMIYDFKVAGL